MPNEWTIPRNSQVERLTRGTEPYHFQRDRGRMNAYPRPAQPNTRQPNQKFLHGWGMSTFEYWDNVFSDYLRRR